MEKTIQPLEAPVYHLYTQGELPVIEGPVGNRNEWFRLQSRNP